MQVLVINSGGSSIKFRLVDGSSALTSTEQRWGLGGVAQQKSVWMFRGWRPKWCGERRNLDRQRDGSVCEAYIHKSTEPAISARKERLWEIRYRTRN